MRVLRLRMLAVKNSMKRSLVSRAGAAIAAGSVSRPARTSAGGAAMASSSVKIMGSLGLLGHAIRRLLTLAFLLS